MFKKRLCLSLPNQRLKLQLKVKKSESPSSQQLKKKLLIDVSILIKKDAGTGIQRVVKALLQKIYKNLLDIYDIQPIYCTKNVEFKYAKKEFLEKYTGGIHITHASDVINVKKNDIFLGLDLNQNYLQYHISQLNIWKIQGLKLHFIVYDLLPQLYPKGFTKKNHQNHQKWLEIIAVYSNSLICISNNVKHELRKWLIQQGFSNHTPLLKTIPMGVNLGELNPNKISGQINPNILKLEDKKILLMVGTLEPRKGYNEVINSMCKLWEKGEKTSLVIVGKKGWKTKRLEKKIQKIQKKYPLYWFNNTNDYELQYLYQQSHAVIAASYAEGYGLPLIEAMYFNKQLLIRDIPIFREVTREYNKIITFSSNLNNQMNLLINTAKNYKEEKAYVNKLTWEDSYKALIKHI